MHLHLSSVSQIPLTLIDLESLPTPYYDLIALACVFLTQVGVGWIIHYEWQVVGDRVIGS